MIATSYLISYCSISLSLSAGSAKVKTKWYISPMSAPTFSYSSLSSQPSDSSPLAVSGEVNKPKGNTLLHLFGEWLFEAAVWPRKLNSTDRTLYRVTPSYGPNYCQ